jgi:trimethyllysine dioxygenase
MSEAVLKHAVIVDGGVEVTWVDGAAASRFSAFWLRDHCHAPESLHPETLQRQVDTFAIPPGIAPERVAVIEDGRALSVLWVHDGFESRLPARFLRGIAETEGREPAPTRTLWDRASMGETFPTVPYDEIVGSEAGMLKWLTMVEAFGFAIASGTPATPEATQALAEKVGYIRQTIFGGFWDFTADLKFKDTAYTPLPIGPHTDGTYSIDSPGLQMFHCLQFDGTGAENTLVDGFRVAETIRRTDPGAFTSLTSVRVPAQYLGDGVHLRASHPIIELDETGAYRQIAYNNYDRAPFRLPPHQMEAFYHALGLWNRLVNDPRYEIAINLRPGTALLFDNWRTLHGRRAYQGYRRLCGAYLNREDFESKLRVLRAGA